MTTPKLILRVFALALAAAALLLLVLSVVLVVGYPWLGEVAASRVGVTAPLAVACGVVSVIAAKIEEAV